MTDCNHPKATLRQGTESLLRRTHKGEQLLSKRERKGDNSLWDDGGYSVRGGGLLVFLCPGEGTIYTILQVAVLEFPH